MAQNNLRINVIAQLNTGLSINQINTAIRGIEKKIKALQLNIKVNDNVLSTLNNFATQMQKVNVAALKTGNTIQSMTNKANQNLQGQIKTLKQLSQGYERVNVQVKKYADGTTKSITSTLKDDKGNGRVITQNGSGQVTGYKDIKNIEKFQLEQDKLRKSLIELARTGKYTNDELRKIGKGITLSTTLKELTSLQSKMTNMKLGSSLNSQTESVRQSLKKMYDQGLVNQKFFQNFNKVINSAKNVGELEKIKQALQRVNDAGKNKNMQQSLLAQAQTLLGGNSKKLNTTGVNNLINQLKNLKPNATSAANELKRIEQQLKQYQAQAKVAGAHTLTFGSALKQALAGFSLWSLTAQMVYAPIRALQDMTQRLIEIDTLMTDIRRVMDMPDFKFTQLLEEAVDTSDQLSSKLTDVLKVMGDFGRMGFGEGQLVDITKTAQVLQNISDLDATASVDTLTSAMLNFNITADKSIEIADKLNEVDNNFAISTKDLSDGIRKAAASAKTFGVDINELTGYIAAIGSTTRESGSIIGNGLKTIFSRMTTMNDAIGALQNVGVSIRDMAGNVRPVSDIMGDLAGKWSSLTDEQRQNTAVSVAGRYQLTRFLALMNNFSIAQSATTTAINSSGSAMKEQNKYADSLEARINRLDTAWNKFTLSVGNAVLTDGIIGGVESLNDLATGVAKLVDKFGLLSGVFGIIGVATVGLSTKFRTFTTSMIFGTSQMTRMQLASVGLTAGMGRLGIATLGVKTAFRGLLASTGVGLLFVGIGFAIEKLIGYYSDAKQAQEEFEQSQQKGVDALTKNKQETEHLIEQYNGLTEAKKQLGENWSTKQEDQYLQIQQRLADLYPQLISYIDGAGNAHLKSKDAIEQELQSTNKLIDAKKLQQQVDAKKDISKAMDTRDGIQKNIERTQTELNTPTKKLGYGEGQTIVKKTENDIKALQSQLLIYQNQWSSAAQLVTSKVLTIAEAYSKLQIDPNISQSVNNFFSSIDTTKLDTNQLEAFAVQIAMAQDAMQKAYASADSAAFDKAKQQIQSIGDQMGATSQKVYGFALSYDGLKKAAEMGASAVFAGKDGMDGLDESVMNLDGNVSSLSGATDGLAGTFNGLEGAANSASDALSGNVNAAQILFGVTADEIQILQNAIAVFQALSGQANLTQQQQLLLANATNILSAQYPQLNGQIKENIGWISSQAGMMSSLSDVSGTNAATMIQNQNATTRATIAQINQRIAGYQKEAAALNGLIERIKATYEMEGMSGAKTYAYNKATTRLGELNTAMATAQASKVEAYYSSGVKTGQVKPYTGSSSGGGGSSKSSDAEDKQKAILDDILNKLDKYDYNIKSYSDDFEKLAYSQSKVTKGSQEWLSYQSQNVSLLKAQLGYQQDAVDYIKNQLLNNKSLNSDQKQQLNQELFERMTDYWQLQTKINDSLREFAQSKLDYLLKNITDAYDEATTRLDDINKKMDMAPTESERAKYLKNEIALMKQRQRLAVDNILKLQQERAEMSEFPDIVSSIDEEIKKWSDNSKQITVDLNNVYSELADNIINIYKDMYSQQKDIAEKAIDDELNAYKKATDERLKLIDKQENDNSYNKDLTTRQKELQDLQKQIDRLRLDDSLGAKAKLADLMKEQVDKQLELEEFMHDRQIDLQKEALQEDVNAREEVANKQKEEMDKYYDNLINSERNFVNMREQIMQGNISVLQNDLQNFAYFVQQNMSTIGQSISENLLDKLAAAGISLSSLNGNGVTFNTPISTMKLLGFKSGGYTGNDEGLAILHQKELVLEQGDTKNILESIKILRPIANLFNNFKLPKITPTFATPNGTPPTIIIENMTVQGGEKGANDFLKFVKNKTAEKGWNTRV